MNTKFQLPPVGSASESARLFYLSFMTACIALSIFSFHLHAAVEQAKASDSFGECVAVVTHFSYTRGAYGNDTSVIKPKLVELGVRFIRDGVAVRGSQGGRNAFATKLLDLQATTGIKALLTFSGDDMTTASNFLTSCSAAVTGAKGPMHGPCFSNENLVCWIKRPISMK